MTPEVRSIALSLMAGLDCPRSLTVAIMLRYEAWKDLTELTADPRHYRNSDDYLRAAAATEFLRKYDGFRITNPDGRPLNLRAEAIEKWMWSERQCWAANYRFSRVINNEPLGSSDDARLYAFLHAVRKEVGRILGRLPESWEGRFGPGATVTDKARESTVAHKMSTNPSLTPNALGFLVPWIGTQWASASAALGRRPSFVRGNSFFTVPKNSRALRCCAKEPSVNGFYQLGLGRVMKERLRRVGINLKDGKGIHMQVACSASKTGAFATIDLTSASDCLATEVVNFCVPRGWYHALSDLRSPMTRVNGRWYRLEKFSSMGNGFTFELETTIFTAIACVAAREGGHLGEPGVDVFVYGDDIIVPTDVQESTIAALKFFGFTTNARKTYVDGPFRESCGGDYFEGQAVRPYYLESDPDEPHKLISLANGVRRLGAQTPPGHRLRSDLVSTWFRILDYLPSDVRRCRGPEALGDLVIHDRESAWITRWRSSIRFIRVWRPARYDSVDWEGFAYDVQYASALYGVELYPPKRIGGGYPARQGLIPREGVLGYKIGWVPFS